MKSINKTKLATAISAAALAGAMSAPANAVVLGGDNGWEVSYTGFVNLFYNQWDNDTTGQDSAHLQEGLLPNFHTMKAVSPEVGGLRGTSQITFAVDSSSSKAVPQNKGGTSIDMREVFFNVDGSFGTISVGRTLSLYQRQAILKDMTLFGVGAPGAVDGGGTTLGRIGHGYVYPEFNTRFLWQSPDMNGFQISVGIFDPREFSGTAAFETDTPQFQTEATYNTSFDGGTFGAWVGAIWQEQEHVVSGDDVETVGWNVGVDIGFGGFNFVGNYYDGEGMGTVRPSQNVAGTAFTCSAAGCTEADADGYYVQGSYTFNGKTKLGISYGESTTDGNSATSVGGFGPTGDNQLFTVGVYHDINSWLKVVAEYNDQNSDTFGKIDGISVGGFMFW